MASKKWFLTHSPSEKDENRWLLKLSIEEKELDELIKEISLSIGGPFISEDEEYSYTVYIYGVKAENLRELEEQLTSRLGEGDLVQPAFTKEREEKQDGVEEEKKQEEEQPEEKVEEKQEEIEEEKETEAEEISRPEKKAKQPEIVKKEIIERDETEPFSNFAKNSMNLNPLYTFEQFVIGPNSRFTAAAARAVADGPGKVYNPFFIYGGVGLGKTHVMQAAGHHILQNGKNFRIMYVTAEKFMSEVIDGIRTGALSKMREDYKNIDLFLVDDVQFLAESESTQEEFFHIFNYLHQQGKQIILTSDRHPKKLTTLEDRLRSRFEWGLIADIKPPSLETRLAILKKKMILNNIDLDDNVLYFIASTLKSNVRELEGFLKRISAYASLTHQEITMDIVKNLMEDMVVQEADRETVDEEKAEEKASKAAAAELKEDNKPQFEKELPQKPPVVQPKMSAEKMNKISSFYASAPEHEVSMDTVKAAFFYPEGRMKELLTVKEQFNNIIKKHKLKFKLESALEQTYVFNPKMKYTFFAETCKNNRLDVAVILGPPTSSIAEAAEFGDLLTTLLNGEKISLQLIQWDDLSKDSRYLHLALDITLLKGKK